LNTREWALNVPTTRSADDENPQWGKKWGKNQQRAKTTRHKKIQSPLSDWIS